VSVQDVRLVSDEKRDPALKQVVDAKPDLVVLGLPATEQSDLRARLKALGYTGPTASGASDTDLPESIATTPEKHYRVTIYAGTDLTARGETFKQTYRERFGEDPPLSAVLSWEAVLYLAESMEKHHSTSSLRLRDTFGKEATFEGITGPVTFPDRQAVRKLFIISEIEGKRSVERVFSPGE
jgi:ABC-type branched-subunit amino acid transport system substrate-binding protein